MDRDSIVALTAEHVKDTLGAECTGHDWWHTYRVWQNSIAIARHERGADLFVVQLGALLHDIADWKFNKGSEDVGVRTAAKWLKETGADKDTIERVCHIVRHISFKGAGVKNRLDSKEGMIVQDADRLDAIGAIGIARTFAYGGYTGIPIYDPKAKHKLHKSFASYKNSKSSSINHFHEKLLLLKGRMNTKTGKRLARRRDRFMRAYLKEFFSEWADLSATEELRKGH